MNNCALSASALFLFLIAAGHLLRIVFGIRIVANDMVVPMWPSVLAILVCAGLAIWLLMSRRAVGAS